MAERLTQLGWQVDRRMVLGSGLPRLSVSSVGWWGLAALLATATAVCWTSGARRQAQALSASLFILSALWVYLGLVRGLRFGWRLPPLREASVVVAHLQSNRPAPCRVVLVAPLGPQSAIPRGSVLGHPSIVSVILACLVLSSGLSMAAAVSIDPAATRWISWSRAIGAVLLGVVCVIAVALTITEFRLRTRRAPLALPDRTGAAVLLEMARTWPASPHQPDAPARVPELARARPASRAQKIELVVAATGGQALDFVGMRTVLHMALPERGEVPTLYLLVFAPGSGPKSPSSAAMAESWPSQPRRTCGCLIAWFRDRFGSLASGPSCRPIST